MMVRGNGRTVSEVYVFTVTRYAVDAMSGSCDECIPYVLISLMYCCFVFLCVCGDFIDGDL